MSGEPAPRGGDDPLPTRRQTPILDALGRLLAGFVAAFVLACVLILGTGVVALALDWTMGIWPW